jgi:hypothetical protein
MLAGLPIIGILLVSLSLFGKQMELNEPVSGFLGGVGVAWVLLGIIALLVKRFNPRLANAYNIDQRDERSIAVREKSGLVTSIMTFVTLDILAVVFLGMGNITAAILVCVALIILVVTFLIAKMYYRKKL